MMELMMMDLTKSLCLITYSEFGKNFIREGSRREGK